VSAIRCAVNNIHRFPDVDPRSAAEQFAQANPDWTPMPSPVDEPKAALGEDQSSRYRKLFSTSAEA